MERAWLTSELASSPESHPKLCYIMCLCWKCPPLNLIDPSVIFHKKLVHVSSLRWVVYWDSPDKQAPDTISTSCSSPQLNSFTMPRILFISQSLLLCPVPHTHSSFLDFGTSLSEEFPQEVFFLLPSVNPNPVINTVAMATALRPLWIYHYLLKTFSGSQCPQFPTPTFVLSCPLCRPSGLFPFLLHLPEIQQCPK